MKAKKAPRSRGAGRPPRPGRHGWQTWVLVRAMMNVRGVGPKAAVNALLADPAFKDQALQVVQPGKRRTWNQRSAETMRLDYHAAERRRRTDRKHADDCAFWLPVYELAFREQIGPFEAMKRLWRI